MLVGQPPRAKLPARIAFIINVNPVHVRFVGASATQLLVNYASSLNKGYFQQREATFMIMLGGPVRDSQANHEKVADSLARNLTED